jgi:hypothetical protein
MTYHSRRVDGCEIEQQNSLDQIFCGSVVVMCGSIQQPSDNIVLFPRWEWAFPGSEETHR